MTISKNNLFNLKGFIEKQHKIFKKFIPPTYNGTDLERFDKLLINLSEEMFEFKIERDSEEMKNELVDVIMYSGTCIAVWYDSYKEEIDKFLEQVDFESEPQDHDLNQAFVNHFTQLIATRRNFSERKWHKPVDPNQDVTEHVMQIVLTNVSFIKLYIDVLFEMDLIMETLIERIEKKQDYILSLPLQTGRSY